MTTSNPRSSPPNPARALAVGVLNQVLQQKAFAAVALDQALSRERLPARDAGLATQLVYGTLRHYRSLWAALEPRLKANTPPEARALLLSGTFEKFWLRTPPHALVNEYVNLARSRHLAAPALVNAVLRHIEPTLSPEHELPDWLADLYQQVFGDQSAAVYASLLEPQPLWLSLSPEGSKALEREGHQVSPGPQGVDRVVLTAPLRSTIAYQRGQAQPINPASLACVDALGEVEGQRALDLAGGPGIKAAMLAARGAQVTSVELAPHKHRAAQHNLKRLGLSAQLITHDLRQPLQHPAAPFVLLDAPCSGSGTLRSHPEIKLRLTPAQITELAALQSQLLQNAAQLVALGGVLVYAVCSVAPAEGVEQIDAFLKRQPEFRAEPVPELDLPHLKLGAGVLTLPLAGIDGFFMVRLRRN